MSQWSLRLLPDQLDEIEQAGEELAMNVIDDHEALKRMVAAGMTGEEATQFIDDIIEGPQEDD